MRLNIGSTYFQSNISSNRNRFLIKNREICTIFLITLLYLIWKKNTYHNRVPWPLGPQDNRNRTPITGTLDQVPCWEEYRERRTDLPPGSISPTGFEQSLSRSNSRSISGRYKISGLKISQLADEQVVFSGRQKESNAQVCTAVIWRRR